MPICGAVISGEVPAWLTLKVCPASVTVHERLLVLEFPFTETVMLLAPVPLARDTVNHPHGVEFVHAQLGPALMLTVVTPPTAPTVQLLGAIE